MPTSNEIQRWFPSPSREFIKRVWKAVPEKDRSPLEETFKGLPLDRNPLNMLIDLAIVHYKTTFGKSRKVAIIGPTNVGKSTLFNQFVRAKSDQAVVSPIPGTTRINQEADAGIFAMIDTPGADAVGVVGEAECEAAFAAAREADFLILMFDALQGVKQTELDLYENLLALKKPFIIILNKIDLTRKFKNEVIAKAAENLKVNPEEILAVSALKGEGLSNNHCRGSEPNGLDSARLAAISPENRLARDHYVRLAGSCHRPNSPAGDRFHPIIGHSDWFGADNRAHLRLQDYPRPSQRTHRHLRTGFARAHALPTAFQTRRRSRLAALFGDCCLDDCRDGLFFHALVRKR